MTEKLNGTGWGEKEEANDGLEIPEFMKSNTKENNQNDKISFTEFLETIIVHQKFMICHLKKQLFFLFSIGTVVGIAIGFFVWGAWI